jgi:hypothetical protein
MTHGRVRAALLIALALAAVPHVEAAAAAAEATSALRVVVLDPAAGLVVGAKVTVSAAPNRRGRTLTSNATGEARFDRLAAGTYQVHVEAKGFEPADLAEVKVTETETRVEVPLEIQRVREDVQVTADQSGVPDPSAPTPPTAPNISCAPPTPGPSAATSPRNPAFKSTCSPRRRYRPRMRPPYSCWGPSMPGARRSEAVSTTSSWSSPRTSATSTAATRCGWAACSRAAATAATR